ncbi:MAG: hypothetical protein LC744_05260 [Chloroflexi bacterium]|nr:hypothetical protein [Chloroflexota bacterium]
MLKLIHSNASDHVDAVRAGRASADGGLLQALVPAAVVAIETRTDLPGVTLFAGEARSVADAVASRQREFETGRACARRALEQLGVAPAPILRGAHQRCRSARAAREMAGR